LEDTRVPADNNEAEPTFRMCEIHDKVSDHFRSWAHAQAFLTVRFYLQTGAKHGRAARELLTAALETGGSLATERDGSCHRLSGYDVRLAPSRSLRENLPKEARGVS
jgi:hypothetical protein